MTKTIQCRHCRKRFLVAGRSAVQTCAHCGDKTPKRRAKSSEILTLLDDLFSLYVRKSGADQRGICECCTCGKRAAWQHMHAGHWIPRGKWSVRWDHRNVHPQCPQCNGTIRYGDRAGRFPEHGSYVWQRHGSHTLTQLLDSAAAPQKKPSVGWMVNMIEELLLSQYIESEIDRMRLRHAAAFAEVEHGGHGHANSHLSATQ